MQRIGGTIFALLFLVWGVLTLVGGIGAGRGDWIFLGIVLGGLGGVFLPPVQSLGHGNPQS